MTDIMGNEEPSPMEAVIKLAYVEGIDAVPPSILCKDVCKSCMAANRRKYSNIHKGFVSYPWCSEDNGAWEKGKVFCPAAFRHYYRFAAEKNCKYRLEHIISEEKSC